MRYTIIVEEQCNISKAVEKAINKGWQLYGSPSHCGEGLFMQAAIKEDEPPTPEERQVEI